MKKLIFIFSSLLVVGCAGKKEENKKAIFTSTPTGLEGIRQTTTKATTLTANQTSSNLITNPKHGEPGHRCDIAVGAPLNSAPKQQEKPQPTPSQAIQTAPTSAPVKTVNTKGIALNPKHGEPGHRCDIAVGAPLTSTAKQTKTINANQNITATPATVQPTLTDPKNQKTNPPHGQPDHRCDLAVGAPLN